MREVDRAYAAGLIDGEGCIFITMTAKNGRRVNPRPSYTLRIAVSMTHRPTLEWLQATMGGCLHEVHHKAPAGKRWKRCWKWHTSGARAASVIRAISPYLRVKAAEAEVALAFQDRIGGGPLTDEELDIREDLKAQLSSLKKAA